MIVAQFFFKKKKIVFVKTCLYGSIHDSIIFDEIFNELCTLSLINQKVGMMSEKL